MKGDFTRDTFDPTKHFSRVLMQQGRVTLDADANEQAAILLHYMRTLAADLIGPYAAPAMHPGFVINYRAKSADHNQDMTIGAGRIYVDGILVENDADCDYSKQPDLPPLPDDILAKEIQSPTGDAFWVYLDVWERHITYIEDDTIREKALNGPDTCTRAKIVWQVKALLQDSLPGAGQDGNASTADCGAPLTNLVTLSQASLGARVNPGIKEDNACITPPASKYRGTENHLYRVEIHVGGAAGTATFKWSRDNGSVATPWLGAGNKLQVARSRGFASGDWVELSDDTLDLQGRPGTLVLIDKAEPDGLTVSGTMPATPIPYAQMVNPKVRRWNQTFNAVTAPTDGAVLITEGQWIDLEDGIQIRFTAGGQYRTGDYWLIPARVATGNVDWPPQLDASGQPAKEPDGSVTPLPLPPDGIEHHYAPLGFFTIDDGEGRIEGCRCTFQPASPCFQSAFRPRQGLRAQVAAPKEASPKETNKEAAAAKKRTPKAVKESAENS